MKGQESFHARHAGTCRGCGMAIAKGANVWAPGVKGQWFTGVSQGMFHIGCQPQVKVTQMSEEQRQAMLERADRRRGAYR